MFGPAHSASRRAQHFLLTSIVNYSWRSFFGQGPPGPLPFEGRGRACRDNAFELQRDELLRESLYGLDIGCRPTSVDPDVAALRPAELLESLPERRMNNSLMARLDRLAPVKVIGQIGAAIGREFSYSLVHAVVGRDETALKHALAQLEQAGHRG